VETKPGECHRSIKRLCDIVYVIRVYLPETINARQDDVFKGAYAEING